MKKSRFLVSNSLAACLLFTGQAAFAADADENQNDIVVTALKRETGVGGIAAQGTHVPTSRFDRMWV